MEQYLIYLAPPCLGAFIGYMTNYVAIRMLFRPLKPWRFFGLKVPMTPGVIPSKRRDLAINIGKMVGDHLLTSADVSKALEAEGFTKELDSLVSSRVDSILKKDLGPIETIIPKRFQSYFKVGVKVLQGRTLKKIHNHIDSEQFERGLSETINYHLDDFLKNEISTKISRSDIDSFFAFLDKTISDLITGQETGKWINAYIDIKINRIIAERKSINDLLPSELTTLLLQKIEDETPHFLGKISKLIQEPVMQDRIARAICNAIESFITTLGPLAALVGNFLDPKIIDEKVRDFLNNKGDDIANWMIDDTVQEKVGIIIREKLADFLATPISKLIENVDDNKITETKKIIINQITAIVQNPNIAESVTAIIREAILSQADKPLLELLEKVFSPDGVAKGKAKLTAEIVKIVRSKNIKRILDTIVIETVRSNLLARPIGPLTNFLPKKVQKAFCDYLLQAVGELLVKEVPPLVDSLNISRIVTKKVDSLDLLRLENLLLSIMQEQFKYINMFGGFLGFLIGLLNIIFLL